MSFLGALFSNFRVLVNDTLLPSRNNIRLLTGRADISDQSLYGATEIDLTVLEDQADAADAVADSLQTQIDTVNSVLSGSSPGGAAARVVWQPGGVDNGNIFEDFIAAATAALAFGGALADIVLDDSAGALALPGSEVDLGGRIRFFADHDVTLFAGNNARLRNCVGTKTTGNAEITLSVSGTLGGAVFTWDALHPASREPDFQRINYTITSGSRRLMDLSLLSAVSFDESYITALTCTDLTITTRSVCTFSADPIIASGNVTINYYTGIDSPPDTTSIAGTFTEVEVGTAGPQGPQGPQGDPGAYAGGAGAVDQWVYNFARDQNVTPMPPTTGDLVAATSTFTTLQAQASTQSGWAASGSTSQGALFTVVVPATATTCTVEITFDHAGGSSGTIVDWEVSARATSNNAFTGVLQTIAKLMLSRSVAPVAIATNVTLADIGLVAGQTGQVTVARNASIDTSNTAYLYHVRIRFA